MPTNPVTGVKRPRVETYEGKTPALEDHQARRLMNAPDDETLKGKRDQAILSMFLFHELHREEVALLKVKDKRELRGVKHLRVHGKSGKIRNVPLHPGTAELVLDYLELAGHSGDPGGGLFRSTRQALGLGPSAVRLYQIVTI